MDPNAAIRLLVETITEGQYLDAYDISTGLAGWLARDGFMPDAASLAYVEAMAKVFGGLVAIHAHIGAGERDRAIRALRRLSDDLRALHEREEGGE